MKRIWYQIFLWVLVVAMLACSASCQTQPQIDEPGEQEQPTEENPTPDVEKEPTEIQLSAKYVLIRPEERRDEEVKAVQLLWRALGSLTGENYSMETDYFGKDAGADDAERFEILVGETNRDSSKELRASLSYNDWSYRVVDQHTILICGGSPEATYAAACAFLKDQFGYEENVQSGEVVSAGSATALAIGTEFNYQHQYAITSFTLGAHALSEYSLVLAPKTGSEQAAQTIVDHFVNLTGIELPIVTLSTYKKGDRGPAIFLGCIDVDGNHLDMKPYSSDRYYIFDNGEQIVVDYKDVSVAKAAAKRLIKACTPGADAGESITVTLSAQEPITGVSIPDGTNELDLDSSTTKDIAPGVVYEERLYYDPNGKPVRAYMIYVEKGAATIATSLPGDVEKIGTYASILDQVIAAKEHDKNVVAGINADFFGDTMLGLCVREGVELHAVSDRPWFGVTKDGTPVLGTANEYRKYKDNLMCAVGGSNVIIDNDYITHISIDHEFGYTRHPRTAVGIKADGTAVLLVVDGRQSKVSNGAALADLADILGSVGCVEAINLDGGGSSTFVLTDGNGGFTVTNSPSDGSLRGVANGLMVILP